jgi:hypothetical protein
MQGSAESSGAHPHAAPAQARTSARENCHTSALRGFNRSDGKKDRTIKNVSSVNTGQLEKTAVMRHKLRTDRSDVAADAARSCVVSGRGTDGQRAELEMSCLCCRYRSTAHAGSGQTAHQDAAAWARPRRSRSGRLHPWRPQLSSHRESITCPRGESAAQTSAATTSVNQTR